MAARKKKTSSPGRRSAPAKRKTVTKKRGRTAAPRKKTVVKKKVGRPPKKKSELTIRHRITATPETIEVTLGTAGRIVIPSTLRTALGVDAGDVLRVRVSEGRLVASTAASDVKYAQELLEQHNDSGSSITCKRSKRGR